MATMVDVSTLEILACANCGIRFALPADYIERRRNDHAEFFCPSKHTNYYPQKSEAEKLRDELAREKHKAEQAQADAKWYRERTADANERTEKVKRSLRATKAVVTRTKKKIVAGRCPCCSFKVKDLAEHMKSQHPKYDPEKAAAAIEAKGS